MPAQDTVLSVSLTDHSKAFIDAGVEAGRFKDAGEAIDAGLLLLERREQKDRAKLERLRAAIQKGFDSYERGEYVILRSPEEIREHLRKRRIRS